MKNRSLCLIATLCLSMPTIAVAEPGGTCPSKGKKYHYIESMDTNKDGKVSLNEFKDTRQDYLKRKFERMDSNGDGFITKDDKKPTYKKYTGKFFDQADANNDGMLSKEEFTAAKQKRYNRAHPPR